MDQASQLPAPRICGGGGILDRYSCIASLRFALSAGSAMAMSSATAAIRKVAEISAA